MAQSKPKLVQNQSQESIFDTIKWWTDITCIND